MNYVTIQLMGGIGNQLWEVAAAETIAKKTGRCFAFENYTTPKTEHSNVNYFLSILKAWAHTAPTGTFSNATVVKERSYEYTEDWSTLLASLGPVSLLGYFQNYRYIPDDFCSRLHLRTTPHLPENMAFIHVRGGDYVNPWNRQLFDVGLNDGRSSYYERAIALFADDTLFMMFTNDYPYAQRVHWLSSVSHRIVWAPMLDEEHTLATMAACPRGGICPNSTFSWWAAWIGHTQERRRRYVLPDRWFNDPSIYVYGYYFPGADVLPV